ncbi:aldo/keto reductase [Lachnospiraceae bacterium 62-35]
MKKIRLGKTGLTATKTAMGCLPIQRCEKAEAVRILKAAYEGGINFFDTANAYTDSEVKIGEALSDVRNEIILATKSTAKDKKGILLHIENSLKDLKTDYIDLFQFHNVSEMPDPNDPNGSYAGALEAKKRGWIGHIGITTHRIIVAEESIASGYFETLQFPFSYISGERDLALAEKCKAADMGYIAMKGLAGGLLTNARACYAFMNQYDNVLPIWGIQRMEELEQWLEVWRQDVKMDEELAAFIQKDREQFSETFCRGCGYCMPCPKGIDIKNCARMNMLLRRSPWKKYYSPMWKEMMGRINDCIGCNACKSRCPYQLNTPELLKDMLKDYHEFYEEHKHELVE